MDAATIGWTSNTDQEALKRWYSASQPLLFPPLFMFERMARVDFWVVLEEAQFDRTHAQFKLGKQPGQTLVSPELLDASRKPFDEIVMMDSKRFTGKMARTIQMTYGKSRHYREMLPLWETLLHDLHGVSTLAEYCQTSMQWMAKDILGLTTIIVRSKKIIPIRPEDATDWMLSFSRPLSCRNYEQGMTGIQGYFDIEKADKAGVKIWAQNFYSKLPGVSIMSDRDASVLSPLFNFGAEALREDIKADQFGFVGTAMEVTL